MKYYTERRAEIMNESGCKYTLKTYYVIYTIKSALFGQRKVYDSVYNHYVNAKVERTFKTQKQAEDYITLLEKRNKINEESR